jgi:hypothetical protein
MSYNNIPTDPLTNHVLQLERNLMGVFQSV